MSISTAQIFRQGVTAMLNQQDALSRTQLQLATGQRILAPSDDPFAATRVLELDQQVERLQQFQRNADYAESQLRLEENVLVDVGNILQRVRELAVRGLNDTVGPDERRAIATEVRGNLDALVQLANTRDANDDYMFAGYKSGTEPFSHDGAGNFSYAGDQGQRYLHIGTNRQVAMSDNGVDVFLRVDDGAGGVASMFDAVHDFVLGLEANNPNGSTLTRIDSALDEMLTTRARIGARLNSIDNQRNINDAFNLSLQENRSTLEDLDYAEAVSRFQQQLLALQASQQSFVKIEGLSLFNYL